MKKPFLSMLVGISAVGLLAGCTAKVDMASPTSSGASSSSVATNTATTTATAQNTASFPVTVKNCGLDVTVDKKPTRVVTLNQGVTEMALALGAGDQMVGTAYLDDEIDPAVKEAYEKIPVLAEKYPSKEALLNVKPDFVIGSYASAFKDDVAGNREELEKLGIESFLDPFACKDKALRPVTSWDSIYKDVTDLGALLGREAEAKHLVEKMQKNVSTIEKDQPGKGKTFLWYDSGTDTPFVGAGKGGPQLILDTVGGTNIFADLDGNWADGSWEAVLAKNPDYIVLADASWDTAEAKKQYLKSNPSTKDLDAVAHDRFIVVPFAESTTGVHTSDGAKKVADALAK